MIVQQEPDALDAKKKRARRVLILAVLVNVLLVYPLAGYDFYLTRNHAPINKVLAIGAIGLCTWAAVFFLTMKVLRNNAGISSWRNYFDYMRQLRANTRR